MGKRKRDSKEIPKKTTEKDGEKKKKQRIFLCSFEMLTVFLQEEIAVCWIYVCWGPVMAGYLSCIEYVQ